MPLTLEQVKAAGGYSIIYADPPWSYDDRNCNGGVGEHADGVNHYKTMSPEDIASLPIGDLAAPDAVLFLWGTYPKLADVLALIPRWGFTYKSIAFQWVKTRGKCEHGCDRTFLGLGRWTRGNTEPCFLAVRGKPKRVSAGVAQIVTTLEPDVLVAPVGRHSAKPVEVRDRIVTLMGDLPRIELFARERGAGWDAWGNDPALGTPDVVMP